MVIKVTNLMSGQLTVIRTLYIDAVHNGNQGTYTVASFIEDGIISEPEYISIHSMGFTREDDDGFIRITKEGITWWRKNNGS